MPNLTVSYSAWLEGETSVSRSPHAPSEASRGREHVAGDSSSIPGQRLEKWPLKSNGCGFNGHFHFVAVCAHLSEPQLLCSPCHWGIKVAAMLLFPLGSLPSPGHGMG